MKSELEGRVALVTGAAGGIGRATALAFARRGAKVAAVDINLDGADATADLVIDAGGDAISVQTDVTSAEQVADMVKQILGHFGRLDFAHNNAGIAHIAEQLTTTADHSEELWDRTIAVNLKGVWLCMKYELPQMMERGGAIVNTSSILGLVGSKGHAAYVASKHGVAGLTKTAALEYARYGIRVNAVCPGLIRTAMVEPVFNSPRLEQAYIHSQAIRRPGEPEEVANAVVWLCSDEASFVTGHMMSVDGGQVAQ